PVRRRGVVDRHHLAQRSVLVMVRKRLASPRLIGKLPAVDSVTTEQTIDCACCVGGDARRAEEVSCDVERAIRLARVINAGEHDSAEPQAKAYRSLPEEMVDQDQRNAEDD